MQFQSLLLLSAALPVCLPAGAAAQTTSAEPSHQIVTTPAPVGSSQPHAHDTHDGEAIIVSASALQQRTIDTATPVISLSGEDFVRTRQATLGETLATQPGVNVDSYGGGSSRPVIRGQTAPRVEVLSDSAATRDASAISPDHAVVTEPLLLRGIEVLRGPAALLYGGGAIGGAINLLDDKVPTRLPEGGFAGAAEARLGTADKERSVVAGATFGIGPVALRIEGVDRTSDDYQVPGGFGEDHVEGSFNATQTFTLGGSWIGENGYFGLAYTKHTAAYGLPGHNHEYASCHPHGLSLACHEDDDHSGHHDDDDHHGHGDHGDHDDHDHAAPVVALKSQRFDIRSEIRNPIAAIERVRFRAAFTDYQHAEIEEGHPATTFYNDARDVRLDINHSPLGPLKGMVGVQHAHSSFRVYGEEQFMPPSATTQTALYAFEQLPLGDLRLEMALRQEWQKITTRTGFEAEHTPFSVSGAAIWQMAEGYNLALSVAQSQRAPTTQELFSNTSRDYSGIHLATNTWELGTPDLGIETSRAVDLTFRKTTGATTFTVGLYHQEFDDYIYADTLDQHEAFRLVRYTATDATFTGIDGEISHRVSPVLSVTLFGDYVRAKQKGDGGNLPRIPAGKIGTRIDAHWDQLTLDAEYYHVFGQDKIASYETATKGYDMVNATIAYSLNLGPRAEVELFARATNLTNTLAYNHSTFVKDFTPLRGRHVTFGLRTAF